MEPRLRRSANKPLAPDSWPLRTTKYGTRIPPWVAGNARVGALDADWCIKDREVREPAPGSLSARGDARPPGFYRLAGTLALPFVRGGSYSARPREASAPWVMAQPTLAVGREPFSVLPKVIPIGAGVDLGPPATAMSDRGGLLWSRVLTTASQSDGNGMAVAGLYRFCSFSPMPPVLRPRVRRADRPTAGQVRLRPARPGPGNRPASG